MLRWEGQGGRKRVERKRELVFLENGDGKLLVGLSDRMNGGNLCWDNKGVVMDYKETQKFSLINQDSPSRFYLGID